MGIYLIFTFGLLLGLMLGIFLVLAVQEHKRTGKTRTGRLHNRERERGNIVAMLFAATAMVGVLGVVGMQTVMGPATTITKVTQQNLVDNDLLMNAKVVVMHASTLDAFGDEDGDGYVEPVPFVPTSDPACGVSLPAEGGCLPANIGVIQTDPWGTQYAYCVWDHGPVGKNSSANRIDGEDSTSGAVLAIISAGPNKIFETPCNAYDGDPETADTNAVNPEGIGDDRVQIFTYAAAVAGSGGLWELKDGEPTTAAIAKDIEVDGAFRMGFAGENAGEVGTSACTQGSHIGRMRFNPFDNAIEVCAYENSLYEWQPMTGGGVTVIDGDDIALLDPAEEPEPEPVDCTTGPVGTACADGAIYAGDFGGTRLYAAPSDDGYLTWNNGTETYTTTGATSYTDGLANTNTLVGLSDGGAPYKAADACRARGSGWYLPARDELNVLYTNRAAVGGFNSSNRYWSSSETAGSDSAKLSFSTGSYSYGYKKFGEYVRCVRR